MIGSARIHGAAASLMIAGALLAAPPALGATLFGLLSTGEFYRSSNGGATWNAYGSVPVRDAVALVAATTTNDLYLLSQSGSVYRSTNGGATWLAVGAIAASDVASVTIRPDGGILVLTRTGVLYVSANQGSSFVGLAALTGSNWTSLARGPLGRYYALTETGEVKESQNGGASWITVGAVTVTNAVALRRKGAELYMLMASGEVARSLDYGRTWLTVGAMASSGMRALADDGTHLVAVTETGEIATSPNGVSWSWVGAINQLSVVALGTDTPLATGVDAGESSSPRFVAGVPRPNPCIGRGGVTCSFRSVVPDRVRLQLFAVDGRLIASRAPEWFGVPGLHEIHWEPEGLATATYIVRLLTDSGESASFKWTFLH